MQSSSEYSYEVNGNLIDYGKKHLVVRSPGALKRLIDARVQWVPIADYKSRVRNSEDKNDVVTYFDIKLKDEHHRPVAGEPPKTFDIQFLLPESFADAVSCDEELGVAQLDLSRPDCQAYVRELNELLMCWYPIMHQKSDGDAKCSFHNLSTTSLMMKWPWKKVSVSEYFATYDPALQIHKLNLGVGYHSTKTSSIGISIQLSNFPGLTRRGAMVSRKKSNDANSKKRKLITLDAEGNEVEAVSEGGTVE